MRTRAAYDESGPALLDTARTVTDPSRSGADVTDDSVDRSWIDDLEPEYRTALLAAMAEESAGWRALEAALDDVVDVCLRYRHLWNCGDGDGGVVLGMLTERAGDAGLRWLVERVAAAPKRKEISQALRYRVFERDDFTCLRCGARKNLTIDHIHPVSKGGINDEDNLQTLCRRCNTAKGARI